MTIPIVTRAVYTADGTTKLYNIPFEYLSRSHVNITVDGQTVPFDYANSYAVTFSTAPTAGQKIIIERKTPYNEPFIVWCDGTVLIANDLNAQLLQVLYVLQENQHILYKNTLRYSDILNAFDFQNIHATNVPNPVNPTDIVNYRTMTTTLDTWFETTAVPILKTYLDKTVTETLDTWFETTAVPILKTYLDKTATDVAKAQEQADAAQLQAIRSCACAASAKHWYAEINAVLKNVDPNFFSTFFILAGVADGGGGDDFEIITSDGGSASTVLFIDRANDGMSSNPDEWYVVNPMIAEALRGRSIISATLQDNGEIIFVTD